jgi:NADPH:quinone reductase-like Zn-dependent oxidoreductase
MRNLEQAHSLGADHVIDYTQQDFITNGRRYDLILDIAATKSWSH